MRFKGLTAAVLVLLVLTLSRTGPGQPKPAGKALIVPIYFQNHPLYTTFDITEIQGRQVDVRVEEFTSYGDRVVSKSFDGGVKENSWWTVHRSAFIGGTWVDNGWARVLYPEGRDVRVVATMVVEDDPERSANFSAVPPASSFRLVAWLREGPSDPYSPQGETAVVIVNPTEGAQDVTLVFHGRDFRGPGIASFSVRESVRIDARHSLSRFLTELVPSAEDYVDEGTVKGILQVSGETEIAVGALDYFRDTGRFRSVPVVVESAEVDLNFVSGPRLGFLRRRTQ